MHLLSMALLLRHLGLMLVMLAFLMPGHYLPWASFQSQWVAGLGAALVVISAARVAGQAGRGITVPPLAILMLGYAAIPALQWICGQLHFASDAVLASAYFVALGLAMIGGRACTENRRDDWLNNFFAALIAAAGVSVALALAQWLSLDVSQVWVSVAPPGARPFANLAQPNHLALLLTLGVVGTIRARIRQALGGATASLLLMWLGLGLVMTQSRTGWLMAALLVLWCGHPWFRLHGLSLGKVVLAASIFVAAVLSWDGLNDALQLSHVNTLGERMQAGPRSLIWQTMIEAIARAPWFGYGFNQITLAQQAVATEIEPVHRMLESAHNIVLDAALWAGAPFALTLVLAVGAWLVLRVRDCRSLDDWSVLAAIDISYFGQGALVMSSPTPIENPFYGLVEGTPFLYPMVVLALLAAVVASQALISGVFSLTKQAMLLGFSPRVTVVHTSADTEGQIYIPEINYLLMIGCVALVLAFRSSSALAAAYGIAVTGTMAITSFLYSQIAMTRFARSGCASSRTS